MLALYSGFRAALCGRGSASPVAPELLHGVQLLRRCRENPRVREEGEKEEEENEENEGPPRFRRRCLAISASQGAVKDALSSVVS